MKRHTLLFAAAGIVALLATSCSSDSGTAPSPDDVLTPISITANYGAATPDTKVTYSESGNSISAKWQEGDQLLVVYNGSVNTLSLSSGAGSSSATFSGTVKGTPKATSVLICYVRDTNNPSAVSVNNNGEYTYSSEAFLHQDGTLASAAAQNLYFGTTTYGTGEDIACSFQTNTSMLKLTVTAPDDVEAGTEGATLTYKSGDQTVAKATFTVGTGGRNVIYLTVPAGVYTGQQSVVYACGEVEQEEILSATKATFTAGQTYSRSITMSSKTVFVATADDWQEVVSLFNSSSLENPTLILEANINKDITITREDGFVDFNGHTISKLFIQNDTEGKSVTLANGTISDEMDGKAAWADLYKGTVIMENMTVNSHIFTDGHNFVFRSGIYNDVNNYYKSPYPGTVSIYGGNFGAFNNMGGSSGLSNGKYVLYGGKFKSNPANIVNVTIPSGYSVKSNTDSDSATYPYVVSAD